MTDTYAGESINRRAAIKKAAAAGATVGVIWTAPKVAGLSLRPNYASAGSAGSCELALPGSVGGIASAPTSCGGSGTVTVQRTAAKKFEVTFAPAIANHSVSGTPVKTYNDGQGKGNLNDSGVTGDIVISYVCA